MLFLSFINFYLESASKQLLMNECANGNNWQTDENDDSSDKEDDDDVEEANHEPEKFDNLLNQNNVSTCSHLSGLYNLLVF